MPWGTTGPLDDGLPFNYGITDGWGVVIGRFDDVETAAAVAGNMNYLACMAVYLACMSAGFTP